ncbi:MAG TPA: hypothetical protein PKA90_08575 [Ignavibacteria bacterium]|nr:hypothetical protein [Ignavibacteria bacterium]HMR40474.1 hypothetical protein [Ignavibacteria bacterium]
MKKILIVSAFSIFIFAAGDNFNFKFIDQKADTQSVSYSEPNFMIYPGLNLQIETSAFTHPENPDIITASAITNYYEGGYTTGFYISTNGGLNWTGSDNIKNTSGSTITTLGDPNIVINRNGYFIMNFIAPSLSAGSDLKIGAIYSVNNGANWSSTIYIPGVDTADKPISAVDNIESSAYSGRVYTAFDELFKFGEEIKGIYFSYSTDNGVSWDTSRRITNIDPDFKYRLIGDVQVGTSGEVFVLWHSNRSYMGLAKSTNGGADWLYSRDTAISTNRSRITQEYELIYLQSVPSMDIDISDGPRSGWIYTAGVEKSSDSIDVVMHRSTDGGETWNYSKKVNSDSTGSVKLQFMPALNVDKYGGINIIYYDARNSNSNDSFEVYLSRSTDGGLNFTDTKISDHKMKFSQPAVPFFGFDGYIGAYTGLTSGEKYLTPVWYDNSSGRYKAYSSIIHLIPLFNVKVFPEGFYDIATGKTGMRDSVKVYLRSSSIPYAIVDSSTGVFDSVTFNAEFYFDPELNNENYYLDIRHRNSISVWSSVYLNYTFGSQVYYNFTISQASAYGDNLKPAGSKWGIYSGDVNQDGVIDLDDLIDTYNAGNAFQNGYIVQDCNGDSVVDLSDVLIIFNNAQLFVSVITP